MGNAASDKKNAQHINMKLSKNTDRDIIDHLAKQENVQGYLKRLIREDIERGKK